MGPDSRVLVCKSRKQAEQYFRLYKESIPMTHLVRETTAVMQEFTQSGGVRPLGVSLLIAGFDDNGPQLYQEKNRINKDDEIVISSTKTRTHQYLFDLMGNIVDALSKLQAIIDAAAYVPPPPSEEQKKKIVKVCYIKNDCRARRLFQIRRLSEEAEIAMTNMKIMKRMDEVLEGNRTGNVEDLHRVHSRILS